MIRHSRRPRPGTRGKLTQKAVPVGITPIAAPPKPVVKKPIVPTVPTHTTYDSGTLRLFDQFGELVHEGSLWVCNEPLHREWLDSDHIPVLSGIQLSLNGNKPSEQIVAQHEIIIFVGPTRVQCKSSQGKLVSFLMDTFVSQRGKFVVKFPTRSLRPVQKPR